MATITTIYGDMDDSLLLKTVGDVDNSVETTTWVEYRKPGSDEIVHRSVHVTLKEMPVSSSAETGRM
jgi:hypothetical protein